MEVSKKLVAIFIVSIVVISSSTHVSMATFDVQSTVAGPIKQAFKEAATEFGVCYNACQKNCMKEGLGFTHCETKCDEDCAAEMLKARMEKKD